MQVFTDKIERDDFDKMPEEYKDLLIRVLLVQVDSELGGPDLYLDSWVRNAPTLKDQLLLVKTAHEEIDHHRRFARILEQLGVDTWHITKRRRAERILETFRNPLETWAEMGAFGCLIDRVGQFHLEDFTNCSYLPVAGIVPSILEEERMHIAHGERILRDLCATPEGMAEAQAAVNKMYPSSLDMFGRSDSHRSDRYREWGIKGRSNAESRQAYRETVDPFILGLGLNLPDPEAGRHFL
jgi:ring-1,2-phenylacetyl-CoA epoxidase subunit PaaA|tara:strand:- start:1605 stop:2324 length:720 start_codon:yes stop_codon:yes gene_type:complete